MSQQLFATIKKTSKYYSQNTFSTGGHPVPFPVFVDADWQFDKYCVKGGPGGQYWLSDVCLYVRAVGGQFLKVKS